MICARVLAALESWAEARDYVAHLWVFGSRVRGDHRTESDLDLSIDYDDQHRGTAEDLPQDHDELEVAVGYRLHFPDNLDRTVDAAVRSAPVVHRQGKVICVDLVKQTTKVA